MKKVSGLDVHKDSVFVCILSENGEKIIEKFGVLTSDLENLRNLLVFNNVSEVVMESTSVYWMPIWRVLGDKLNLKLVNPFFVKQLPGKKSDVKDAEWLAICSMKELIKGSFVPDSLIQDLRKYNRRIFDLNKEISRKLVKLDALLQRANIRISNYISKLSSKGYKNVLALIASGETNPDELVKKIHGRTRNKHGHGTIRESLNGVITQADIDLIAQYKAELDLVEKHKETCQQKMEQICQEHFPEQLANLQTIPGVKERSATAIIAELGVDMKTFDTASAVVAWCGLKPRNDESAGKIKSRKITHGNKFLRKSLIECALSASQTRNCFYHKFYQRQTIVRKKNVMKVRVAIARKLLTVVWHILSKGETYRDFSTIDVNLSQWG